MLLKNPLYWIFLFICSSDDRFKLLPLYFAVYQDGNFLTEFFILASGDLAMLMVSSMEDTIPFNIGIFFFTIFVWLRLEVEKEEQPKQSWSIFFFPTIACLLIYFYPITQLLLQIYIFSLASLLAFHLSWGYLLYALSDCLLLVSLRYRFPYDWMLIRLIYWSGLTLLYQ